MQYQNNYTFLDCKYCLQRKENKYCVKESFRSDKPGTSLVKQTQLALNTLENKRCFIDEYNSIQWGCNPSGRVLKQPLYLSGPLFDSEDD